MDDLYKKMILALPEDFFTDWQWHIGDKALCLDSLSRGEVIIMDGICHGLVKVAWVDRIFLETEQECIDRLRPVPSQKQLQCIIQSLLKIHNVELNDLEILNRVVGWHNRRDPENKQNKSTDCLFLEVHMWLNNKTWNGEAWI